MADTQQGVRHQSARDAAGTVDTYDGDLRALFEAVATVPTGSTFNEAFMLWLQAVTGSSADNINDLAALFASQQDDTYNWSSVGGLGLPTLFDWEPETAEELPATATFTRASVAQVLTTTDSTTFWYQQVKSGELRLDGLRRVENLLDSSTGTGPFTAITKDGRLAVSVIADTGTLTITIGGTPQVFTPTGTPQRFVAFDDATGGSTTVAISGTATLSQPMAHLCQVGSDVPEPYVQHDAEFLNIGVNGVTYFNTANTSTVDGSGVVTEATGTTITGGGYLPEPAATNQMPISSDYSDLGWTKSDVTETDNGVNELGLREFELDAGTDEAFHRLSDTPSTNGFGSAYFICKQGNHEFIAIQRGLGAGLDHVVFDLNNGTITEEAANATGRITSLGDGWYKCEVENTANDFAFLGLSIVSSGTPGDAVDIFTGSNETVLVCHAQYENTVSSTSPIITSGSTVTRVADGMTLSALLASAPYSGFVDVTYPTPIGTGSGTGDPMVQFSTASDKRLTTYISGGSRLVQLFASSGINLTKTFTLVEGERKKHAYNMELNNALLVIEGETTPAPDTSTGAIPTGDMFIGIGNGRYFRGRIHNFIVYDAAQTQAQLEALVA